jgi:hypothetical protein
MAGWLTSRRRVGRRHDRVDPKAATLGVAPVRHDVRSAFVEMPDGRLIDKDELLGGTRSPDQPEATGP